MPIRLYLLSWLTLLRLGATARGVLPFLLGAVIAWSQGVAIKWEVLVLSTIAVICIMLMTFLVNEYYDYETDVINKDFHKLSGGSRVLPMGLIPRRQSIVIAYVLMSIAVIIGLVLNFYYKTGPLTIPLGTLAIFIGYFYTARPFRFSYLGLGEIAIWFTCGWLANMTGYYLQTGHLSSVTTLISFPGATSVFLVILMNELPDINSDRLSGKNNLAVRLGREKAGVLYAVLLVLSFLNMLVIIPYGVPPISAILSIILIPLIAWNILTLKRRGLASKEVQESLSLRTMLYDHLITVIYAITFVVDGLGLVAVRLDYLLMLAIAFIVVFGLEGLGIVCSRAVVQE